MERRLQNRVRVQFEARLTRINDREQSTWAIVSDISISGISLAIHFQLKPGDLVELEMADSLLSGRVVYSTPESTLFRTGVEVEQIQLGSTELSHLLQMTLSEAMPGTPGLTHSESYIG